MHKMLILILLVMSQLYSEDFIIKQKPHIVEKQKLSRNKLKESLGAVAKELFSESTGLVGRIGKYLHGLACEAGTVDNKQKQTVPISVSVLQAVGNMHQHIAYVQKTCGQVVEYLLDDEPQISKATKVSLNASLKIMRDTLIVVKQLQFDKEISVQKYEADLCAAVDCMKKDPCLRQA